MSETTSVERALAILETFERERRPLSSKELSDFCRIPASTCLSLIQTLLRRAYLYQTGHRKDLYPTRKIYDMGVTILRHDLVLQRLVPAMEQLRDATRETVILGKRQREIVVYLEVLEGPEVIRYSARPGDTKPLHSSAIGKAMLSVLTPAEIRDLLNGEVMPRVTDNTITDLAGLLENLDEGKTRGFFMTRGENVADVTALAVPIVVNKELFGLAVAGPSHRIDAKLADVARTLQTAQQELIEQGIAGHQ